MKLRPVSLSGTFAVLSLVVIALITAGQIVLQWVLLRGELIEWERSVSAEAIRAEVYPRLQLADFAEWRSPESQERFDRAFRRVLVQLEIRRIRVYDRGLQVVWSDEPGVVGTHAAASPRLLEALRGQTIATLERVSEPDAAGQARLAERVELSVPLSYPDGTTPGKASVVGVVELRKNPSRALANLSRDRWTIIGISVAGAALLYAVLFGIVHRASRQLERQRGYLERQTAALMTANEELRETQTQLRSAERLAAIGEVSAAVAHGIRNPLTSIRGAAELVLKQPERVDTGRYLRMIVEEVDRLNSWMRALLGSARPLELKLAPVELSALLDNLLTVLSERIAREQIMVESDLSPDLPGLTADRAQLEQAFFCVLENALDALSPGGRLTVRTEKLKGDGAPWVRATIQDTGVGIPADELARVFQLFYTSKGKHGTGLGLAVTRRVMEAHGGKVEIESRPGEGTTLRISLPVERPAGTTA